VPLVDRAIGRVGAVTGEIAVNVHHGRDALEDHLAGRVHVSAEDVLLGTAGALGRLRPWIDGRDVVVVNADLVTNADLATAVERWDHATTVLLGAGATTLEPDLKLCGALMPWAAVRELEEVPSGLFRRSWRPAAEAGRLSVVDVGPADWFDCGTARSYLAANLWANGGESVVGQGCEVRGGMTRCVLWDDTTVGERERLVDAIRASDRITVLVR